MASNSINNDEYKSLWLSCLPEDMQTILGSYNENLAKTTGKISEVIPFSNNIFIQSTQKKLLFFGTTCSIPHKKQMSYLILSVSPVPLTKPPIGINIVVSLENPKNKIQMHQKFVFNHQKYGAKACKCTKP